MRKEGRGHWVWNVIFLVFGIIAFESFLGVALRDPQIIIAVTSILNLLIICAVYLWDQGYRRHRSEAEIRLYWFRKHVSEHIDENVQQFFDRCQQMARSALELKENMTLGEFNAEAKKIFALYTDAKIKLFDKFADFASIVDPAFGSAVRLMSEGFQDQFTKRLETEFNAVLHEDPDGLMDLIEEQRLETLKFVYEYEMNGCSLDKPTLGTILRQAVPPTTDLSRSA